MGAIKINGSTSGSTTITAPATGSDETIELSTALAEKLPYSYGTATPSTSVDGFLWYDENDTPPTPKFWDGAAFQAIGGGKIAQLVRATDSTQRSTTSTSLVDASLSVTITPTKSTSAILLIWNGALQHAGTSDYAQVAITDSSNNVISGGANTGSSSTTVINALITQIGYATPATTSATTYKLRFRVNSSGTAYIYNNLQEGQLFAIEVLA
jgi:hypothetical protein